VSVTDSTTTDFPEGPEHNARGLFAAGPQFVTPSDVLAKMIAEAKGSMAEGHHAPDLKEQRRAIRIYSGRLAQRIREREAA
jgi:hypothetical protein